MVNTATIETMVCIAQNLPDTGSKAPTEVRLLRHGLTRTTKGNVILDQAGADAILDAFSTRGNDVLWDYEHHSEPGFQRADGKAPAAGWIKAMAYREGDGLYATVEWTADGRSDIEAKSYRYFSPVLDYDKTTRRVMRIRSVALTNTPATIAAEPLVAKDTTAVAELLGLPADTNAETLVAKVQQMQADAGELLALREKHQALEVEEMILDAKRAGKLVECMEPWARKTIGISREVFTEWAAVAPVIRPQGRTTPPNTAGTSQQRGVLIATARGEFKREEAAAGRAMICSEGEYVNMHLRDAGLKPLAGDECTTLQLVM